MTNRESLIQQFLATTPWGDADRFAMAADASGRSYERLTLADETAILMNAPYETGEDVRPFVATTAMLKGFNLSAPTILAQDIKNGFLLLEDLGNDLIAQVCKTQPALETEMYKAAIDVLISLHKHNAPNTLSPYDTSVYIREAGLLPEWYLRDADTTDFNAIASRCFSQISSSDPVMVMRDYHAENLLWLPARSGVKCIGLLDYQDALAGHPAYDLVSLLEDARRDTTPSLRSEMLEYYIANTSVNRTTFLRDYALLGAQRNIKIIGIFARLSLRDGKGHYPHLVPRVWNHLQNDLLHPACHELANWIEANVPAPNAEYLQTLAPKT